MAKPPKVDMSLLTSFGTLALGSAQPDPFSNGVIGKVNVFFVLLQATMVRSCSEFGYSNRDTKESRRRGLKFYRIPVNVRLWLSAIIGRTTIRCCYLLFLRSAKQHKV